jgi:hypothetical protein
MADAAVVTEDQRQARGHPVGISRLPAPESAGGRAIAAAVTDAQGDAVGRVAQTTPTTPRPAASSHVAARTVTLDGQHDRAVVIPSRSQDHRRQPRFAREMASSSTPLATAVNQATTQEDCGRADAAAAAEPVRGRQRSAHQGAGMLEERPTYGPGRPSPPTPRAVHAWR